MSLFGKGGDILSLMKNAGKIKETIKKVQEEGDKISVVGESFNGKIRITILGSGGVVKTEINKEVLVELEHEDLEDYISIAVNDGNRKIKEEKKKLLDAATDELGISPELLKEFS